MKKYYFGLLIIALFTAGLTVFGLTQAAAGKQDKQTEHKAREIADKLNAHISRTQQIPESLEEAGIKDVPATITYTKKSSREYEFCVVYKADSNYSGLSFEGALSGSSLSQLNRRDQEMDDLYSGSRLKPRSLYIGYSHKKGENCQTVEPYISGSSLDLLNLNGSSTRPNSSRPGSTGSSNSSVASRDTERKNDITAIQAALEVFYAETGYYPELFDVNDVAARNFWGISIATEVLRDPSGTSATLAAKPARNVYSYEVTGNNGVSCNNSSVKCTKYTLTATLEAGGTYTKSNLK